MGLTNELQELRRKVKEIEQNTESINTTIGNVEDAASLKIAKAEEAINIKFTEVQSLQKATDTKLTEVNNAVTRAQGAITAVQNSNTKNKLDLGTLENALKSFNQTFQGKTQYVLSICNMQ